MDKEIVVGLIGMGISAGLTLISFATLMNFVKEKDPYPAHGVMIVFCIIVSVVMFGISCVKIYLEL